MTLRSPTRDLPLVRLLLATFALALASAGWASHFTGTYQDPGSRMLLAIEHGTDAGMRGTLVLPDGNRLQLEGRGDPNGAAGTVSGPQGRLEFRAQLSPDGRSLQLTLLQPGAGGGGQQVAMQRVAATPTLPETPPGAPGAAGPAPGATAPAGPTGATGPGSGPAPGGGVSWSGVYVGTGGDGGALRLQLQQTPQGVQGVIETGGARYPLQASGDATRLEGGFQASGGTFGVEIHRSGAGLVLVTGGARYTLAPAAPEAGGGGGNPLGTP